jgi:hypothetical protein
MATVLIRFAEGTYMRTAAEYRAEAEQYIREADGDVPSGRRARLLEMAQSCLRMADQADMLKQEGRVNGHDPDPPQYSGL